MKNITILIFLIFSISSFAQYSNNKELDSSCANQLVHTKLTVSFDIPNEQMFGEEWVTISPRVSSVEKVELDAKSMTIYAVELFAERNKKLSFDYDNKKLKVYLDKTYGQNETFTLYIKYTANPKKIENKYERGLYFIDPRDYDPEKPTQIWTQGQTQNSSCWFPTIDSPDQKMSQEISMTVPDKFVTLSNGSLIQQVKNSNGTRTDTWEQTQKQAPYLCFIAAGNFSIIKDDWNGKPVDYYVEPKDSSYARGIFGVTPKMLTFLSETFGFEYPWDKYSQIVTRDFFSGAMENTTAVMHQDAAIQKPGQLIDRNYWESNIIHEMAHHWFGDLLTCKNWGNTAMNESFAVYSEHLWKKHKYGKEASDAFWLTEAGYYLEEEELFSKKLIRYDYESADDMFDEVSYCKGAFVLRMLRNYIGDSAFWAGVKTYLINNQYNIVDANKLRIAMELTSGRDLNWFFNQWFFGNGHPKLKMSYTYSSDTLTVLIEQTQTPLFEFPFAIDCYGKDKIHHQVWVKKQQFNTFKFSMENRPSIVVPNADYKMLCELSERKTPEEYAVQYQVAKDNYFARKLAMDSLLKNDSLTPIIIQTIENALTDSYFELRKQAIENIDLDASIIPKIYQIAKNDTNNFVRAAAIKKLGALKDNQYKSLFIEGCNNQSYAIQEVSAKALLTLDSTLAKPYILALDDYILTKNARLLSAVLPLWKTNNDTSHFIPLIKIAKYYKISNRKPEFTDLSKEIFQWIMESDSPVATYRLASYYEQIYSTLKKRDSDKQNDVKELAAEALTLKMTAFNKNPEEQMKFQIGILQKLVDETKD